MIEELRQIEEQWEKIRTDPTIVTKLQKHKKMNDYDLNTTTEINIAKSFIYVYDSLCLCGKKTYELINLLEKHAVLRKYLITEQYNRLKRHIADNHRIILYVIGEIETTSTQSYEQEYVRIKNVPDTKHSNALNTEL